MNSLKDLLYDDVTSQAIPCSACQWGIFCFVLTWTKSSYAADLARMLLSLQHSMSSLTCACEGSNTS